MLHFSLEKYKAFHKLDVSDEALSKCVTMAKRYVKDRRLPDSAIDLLDRTMSAVKMTNEAATTDHLSLLQQLKELEEKRIDLTDDDFLKELSEVWRDFSVGLSPIVKGFLNQDVKIDENTDSATVWETLNTIASQIEAFAKKPIQKVEEEHLASVVAAKTNIPVGKIQEGEKEKYCKWSKSYNSAL